ncbi:hypothetical protein BX616_008649, partial [Lobosporangium transversale]
PKTETRHCGRVQLPLTRSSHEYYARGRLCTISLSWNASMVALVLSDYYCITNGLSVFKHDLVHQVPLSEKATIASKLRCLEKLEFNESVAAKNCKVGKFHIIDTKAQDERDELYISCETRTVEIYA